MSEERDNMPNVGQSSTDLLDLVRSAEEAALLPTDDAATSDVVNAFEDDPPQSEDFVEVGEEDLERLSRPEVRSSGINPGVDAPALDDAPPSGAKRREVARAPAKSASAEPERRGLPPLAGIAVMLALAVGMLVLLTR